MTDSGSLLLRPGTIFLFVLILLMGLGMYTWANTSIGNTGERSLENQNDAISCSGLEISREELNVGPNQTEIFFKANKNLEKVKVEFRGSENVNVTLKSVTKGSLQKASANISNFTSVSLKAQSCSPVFRYE